MATACKTQKKRTSEQRLELRYLLNSRFSCLTELKCIFAQRYSFSSWGCRCINPHKDTQHVALAGQATFRFHYVRVQRRQAGPKGLRVIPEPAMTSAMGTVPQGLDTVDKAETQSGAKEVLLTRLETRLQCGSKVCPEERVGDRAEQAVTYVPGCVQEMSYLQRSVQGAGAGARHTYSITEAGADVSSLS